MRYPKFFVLILTFVLTYLVFVGRDYSIFSSAIVSLGYFGVFIAGIFYAYGFTAAPATAVLLSISGHNDIVFAALIGGLGALIGDLMIFLFIRYSFGDEIKRLSRTRLFRAVKDEEKKIFGSFRKHIAAAFAGFFIASPLPTEIGVAMLASLSRISVANFAVIAYMLHMLGILVILTVGSII